MAVFTEKKSFITGAVATLLLASPLAGCELLPFMSTPVVVSGAGGGIAYTLGNVAYKTVSYPEDRVESSLRKALVKMGIKETGKKTSDGVVTITAETKKLSITIDLEKVTDKTTRIKVDASESLVIKDKATATEIIIQTEKALEKGG